jgi:DNA-binding GntR family transcriptional regulator
MATSADIGDRIIEATLTRKLGAGARLGEQELAALFGCSRTIVREALTRLSARGIVTVSARKGWYLADPSADDARTAFAARRVIETGLIRCSPTPGPAGLHELRTHVARQQAALARDDVAQRSFLLGDFHVCLARAFGNPLLADILRDLTVRTTLVAMRHQSAAEAAQSCAEHASIVDALAAGDSAGAEAAMASHLAHWDDKLHVPAVPDRLAALRHALGPTPTSVLPAWPPARPTPPSLPQENP